MPGLAPEHGPEALPGTPSDYPRELTMYGSIPHTGRVHLMWSLAVGVFLWAVQWALRVQAAPGIALTGPTHSLPFVLTYTLCLGYWCWTVIGIVWLGEARRRWPLLPDARQRYERRGVYGLLRPSTLLWVGLLGVPLACVLGMFTAQTALAWLLPARGAQALPSLPLLLCLVLSYSLALGTFMVDYLRVHLAANQVRAEAAQRQALQAQLQLLQAQLEPHMLFNTLANLHALIDADPSRAQEMLQRLITFLRATLSASQRTTHPLGEEFSRASDYLALMQVRMGQRLSVELSLPPELADAPVPPLLVQPLLENAIQHGLEPKREGGMLSLRAQLSGERLIITVHDTGQGLAASKAPGRKRAHEASHGFGLSCVRDRLQSLYGSEATLNLNDAPTGPGTMATLSLPLKPAAA